MLFVHQLNVGCLGFLIPGQGGSDTTGVLGRRNEYEILVLMLCKNGLPN